MAARLGQLFSFVGALLMALFLTGCGGSEAPGAPAASGSQPGAASASSLQLTLSRNKIQTGSSEAVDITVTAVDSANRAVPGAAVSLASSSGIIEAGASAITDATGQVKAKLRLGQDRSNRVITITAVAGAVKAAETIDVSGTTAQVVASRSIVSSPADVVTLTVTLRDAAQQPIGNQPVTFSTNLGTLASQSAISNASGLAEVKLSGVTGAAIITVSAAGGTATTTVTAQQVTIPAMSPENPTITAFFVQVNPSVIGPNTGANAGNFAEVVVTVRGDDPATGGRDVPVMNAPIKMWIANNPAPGSLAVNTSVSPALTNASGQVTNRFIAGAATTSTDGVILCARIEGRTIPNPASDCGANAVATRLTIAAQPLFVKLSTNDLIESVDQDLNYRKKYSVFVTDAVGRGVAGVSITPRLSPVGGESAYGMGHYEWNASSNAWSRRVGAATYVLCPNEDENLNGTFEGSELDYNGNQVLDPGQVAAVNVEGDGKTDGTGVAVVTVKYGKRYATWGTYDLQVRGLVGGTEGSATMVLGLDAAVDDIKSADVAPPFKVSPFGEPLVDRALPALSWPVKTSLDGSKRCRLIYPARVP